MSKRPSSSAPVGEPSSKARKRDDTTVTAVGMRFREWPRHVFSKQKSYHLVRDNDNPYDDNAIKLMHGDQHLAFLCREDAATWAPQMDAGVQLRVAFTDRWPNSATFALTVVFEDAWFDYTLDDAPAPLDDAPEVSAP